MSEQGAIEIEGLPAVLELEQLRVTNQSASEREKVFNSEVYPGITSLAEKGVKFYEVSSKEFFEKLPEGIKFGYIEAIRAWNRECGVVCQIGEDRSDQYKVMANDVKAPVVMTPEDARKLEKRTFYNPYAKIGMSYADLGRRIKNGKIVDGKVIPQGFTSPITRVLGFTDSLKELGDLEGFCKDVDEFYRTNGQEPNLEIVIVEGKSANVEEGISALRKRLEIKSS